MKTPLNSLQAIVCFVIGLCLIFGRGSVETTIPAAPELAAIPLDHTLAYEEPDVVEVKPDPVPETPKPAPPAEQKDEKKSKVLIAHTMHNCPACKADAIETIPVWVKSGYTLVPADEGPGIPGSRYPWYEIFDGTGRRRLHIGRLPRTPF